MKIFFATVSFTLFAHFAHAALPGYYQSINEIKAILDSDEVAEKMDSPYRIEAVISKQDAAHNYDGGYDVTTSINNGQKCVVNVKLKYSKPAQPFDPRILTLLVGNRTCN